VQPQSRKTNKIKQRENGTGNQKKKRMTSQAAD
jgi:hypothetical protein